MGVIDGQLCFLEPPETDRLRRWHWLNNKEYWTEASLTGVQTLPADVEVIVVNPGRDDGDHRFYRTMTQMFKTRFGKPEIRLVSYPTNEWPEIPPWQNNLDGKQVLWPCVIMRYFLRVRFGGMT